MTTTWKTPALVVAGLLAIPATSNLAAGGHPLPCNAVVGHRVAAMALPTTSWEQAGASLGTALAISTGPSILAARDGHLACQAEVFRLLTTPRDRVLPAANVSEWSR